MGIPNWHFDYRSVSQIGLKVKPEQRIYRPVHSGLDAEMSSIAFAHIQVPNPYPRKEIESTFYSQLTQCVLKLIPFL